MLKRINVYTGRSKDQGRAPVPHAQFLTDHKGQARFAAGSTSSGEAKVYYRKDASEDWILVHSQDDLYLDITPLAFASENEVYVAGRQDHSIEGLYKWNMESGKKELLYLDDYADPAEYLLSADQRKLYGLVVQAGYPNYVFVDEQAEETKLLKAMISALDGQFVRLRHQSYDGRFSVVTAGSDRDPGSFYLYDSHSNKMRFLAKARPWVDPAESAEVRPIRFEARDGLVIHGLLTLPRGREDKGLPLIVHPHGGPHGPRDWWGYNSTTQFLASRGYAVLQVNFRGSGGYGKEFEKAGYRHWGDKIQYDILDGTHYVIEQGIVDKERICIYGASFGGYSALQAAVVEPDLFKCTLGFVGVYDLEMMHKKGDIPKRETGRKYLNKVIGKDKQELIRFSPVHNVDKLKASVFILHGKEDERVPIEQAYALRDALDAIDYPYKWKVVKKEGHGFYNEDNRAEMFEEMVTFFDEHLKL
ncbi:hypothetical protein GCM10023333_18380 [Ferrimonas pelagia]|uniref:Peptidase S9 prolyl oligopeptidase catalytic domain-containing protein n=2 Tax=Ferrimonas pelagia TaxID=1177826 RepID=A0ABP9EQV0_9GAMM